MNKLCLFLLTLPICAAGCTSTYMVHVNGFSEVNEPIKENASIYVAVDPNSRNPIFDNEIKTRIETLLKQQGYVPAANAERLNYRLTFKTGLDSHSVSGYMPLYRPYFGFRDRYWGYYHFDYYGYAPYIDTYYDQWLVIRVFATKPGAAAGTEQVIWIGEAVVASDIADLRQVINYLLVTVFGHFGQDTGRQIVVKIAPDDPRVLEISALR